MTSETTTKARRPKGTGSVRHKGGDRYQLLVKVDGAQVSRVFTARNETEANKAAGALHATLLEEQKTRSTTRAQRREWTLARYVPYYFDQWGGQLADTTREQYKQAARNHVLPYIGKKKLEEVTPSDLSALYQKLGKPEARRNKREGSEGKGLSPLTIWHAHTFIGALYTFANRNEDTERHPARKVTPNVPKTPQKTAPAMGHADVARLLDCVRSECPELYPAVLVTARLGVRRGELCGLRWSDIDFENREVSILRRVTQTTDEGVKVAQSTKTGKERTIPIDSETVAEFKRLRAAQRRERLRLGRGWKGARSEEDDYVCTAPTGSVLVPNRFEFEFRTFRHAHGFETITPHVLRHALASQLIATRMDAVTIASILGHSPDVLLKTYAHAFDTRKREAMDALGEAREAARVAE